MQYDGRSLLAESSFDARYVTAIDVAVTVKGAGKAGPCPGTRPSASTTPPTSPPIPRPRPDAAARGPAGERARCAGGDDQHAPRQPHLDRAPPRRQLRQPRRRCAPGGDGGGDRPHQWRRIRGNRLYPAGTVLTRRDILTELPFGNTTVLVSLTGAQVRTLLESALADLGRPAGSFPAGLGSRRHGGSGGECGTPDSVHSGGRTAPRRDADLYGGLQQLLYDGGNGYGLLADGRTLIGATDGKLVANEVMAYIGPTCSPLRSRGRPDRDPVTMPGPLSLALHEFRASGSSWLALPFFPMERRMPSARGSIAGSPRGRRSYPPPMRSSVPSR